MKLKIKDAAFVFYEYSIELCLGIKKRFHGVVKYLLFAVCFPYIFLRGLVLLAYDYTVGRAVISRRLQREAGQEFPYELGIVAIAKNEGPYVREWLDYHLLAGGDKTKIYLYDNESTDNMAEIIKPYIRENRVEYTFYPGKEKQNASYNDAVSRFSGQCRYMAFIDMDEFIVPGQDRLLPDVVAELISKKPNAGGVGVNWALYGSSGYQKREGRRLLDVFLKRAETEHWVNRHVKTICNPRLVKNYISPHFPVYRHGTWSIDSKGKRQRLWFNRDVTYEKLRISHYFCKSREEFLRKRSRGKADRLDKYQEDQFDKYDLNDVTDDRVVRYLEWLKENKAVF